MGPRHLHLMMVYGVVARMVKSRVCFIWYSNGLNSVNELNLKGHDTKMVGEKEL